jgi:DNA glycosylase AlkZ-like
MASRINLNTVNRFRLHKQHLTDESQAGDIVQITRDIYGLHATNATTPYLSLFARFRDFTRDKLDEELYVKKTLGKIRCIRTTVHVLPRETIPIAFASTKAIVGPNSEDFLRYTGAVTKNQYEEASRAILDMVKGRGMSTVQIRKHLGTKLNVSPIVNLMCDQGLLMRGQSEKGWKSNTHTYYPFSEYFPGMDLNAVEPAEARETTVKQYLASYGPVSVKDISWWSGFTMTEVCRILQTLARETAEVGIPELEGTFVMLAADKTALERFKTSTQPAVNLLPALDPYLMGYKERGRYLDYEHYDLVFDRSGNSTSTILVDGRVVGVWDFGQGPKPTVKLFFFHDLEKKVLRTVESRARATGEFIGDKAVAVEMCDKMVPLPQRNAGGFMSPLGPSTGRTITD